MRAGTVAFYNFNPETVFAYLSNNDYEGCWSYMLELLDSFSNKKNRKFTDAIHYGANKNDSFKDHLTKFSGLAGELLIALFTNPSVEISDNSFIKLLWNHETIHNLFAFCGVRNTDEIISKSINSNSTLSLQEQKKLLLLLSFSTKFDIVQLIRKMDVRYQCLAVCAYLNHQHVYIEKVHANKIRLIEEMSSILSSDDFAKAITSVENRDDLIAALLGSYFTCSYLQYDGKHELKKHINAAVMALMSKRIETASKNLSKHSCSPVVQEGEPHKPRLLVVLEAYGPTHAMKRCYDVWLQQYRDRFDVCLCIAQEFVYPELQETYHVLPFHTSDEFLGILFNHRADIVLFPSVGMTFWGILGSNLRVAPIQVMFLGHPAATESLCIDAVYGPEEVHDKRAFKNDVFIAGRARYRFGNPLDLDALNSIPVTQYDPLSPRPLRVSIVGSAIKITSPFLKLLWEIKQESNFRIEFLFHLTSTGTDAFLFENDLKALLGDVTLYGFQPYTKFLETIGQTDIVLNPFPFGHTNTIIDTLLMGKPCVSYVGSEPASRTEHYVLSLVKLEDKFEVSSEESYKRRFRELAEEIRGGNTKFFDREDVYQALILNEEIFHQEAFAVDDLMWIVEHTSEIKTRNKELIRIDG